MNFKNIDFTTPSVEEQYLIASAHYNDRFYIADCACGKELVGKTKSDLREVFRFHFPSCPANK